MLGGGEGAEGSGEAGGEECERREVNSSGTQEAWQRGFPIRWNRDT